PVESPLLGFPGVRRESQTVAVEREHTVAGRAEALDAVQIDQTEPDHALSSRHTGPHASLAQNAIRLVRFATLRGPLDPREARGPFRRRVDSGRPVRGSSDDGSATSTAESGAAPTARLPSPRAPQAPFEPAQRARPEQVPDRHARL